MTEPKRYRSQQEEDMLQRVEMMAEHRAQQAAEEASRKSAEPAPPETETSAYESGNPADLARVKVRGAKDDEARHNELARWERSVDADASANGGVLTPKARPVGNSIVPRLLEVSAPLAPPADTETELNGLIAECRYLMREIAFNSARLTYDPDDRVRFLASAQSMALAAAKVGRTVAQLRGASGGTRIETRRCELVYRHEHTTLSPTPSQAESEKQ